MFDLFKQKVFNFNQNKELNTISQAQFIQNVIDDFDLSNARFLMLTGEKYYKNINDISNREIYRFESGVKVVDETKANNKINHAFMKNAVDEKIGYFLGQAPTITSTNAKLQELAIETLNEDFDDVINDIGIEASNKGIAWLHIYIDTNGEFKFMLIPAEQIIPLWADMAHTKLDALIRYYYIDTYIGLELKKIKKVEYWTNESVMYYVEGDKGLIPDIEANETADHVGHFSIDGDESGWGKIPFIPFKNNSYELPDIYFVKDLVDQYDLITSDNSNLLQEIKNVIMVLRNYGGTDLSSFMSDLSYYKAVKVDDDGGVDTIKTEINIEAAERTLDRLKNDFFHFGQSVNMDNEKFGQNPSGVALEFLYSKLKLKVDNMERKFKKSFKLLFYFMCEYYKISNQGVYDYDDLKVTFTRSTVSNLKETVETVNASVQLISKKTAMEHHPWVEDVETELQNIEDEADMLDFNSIDNPALNKGQEGGEE